QGEATGWTRLGPVRLHASVAVSAFDERFTVGRDSVPVPPDSASDFGPRVVTSIRSRRYADGEVGAEWRPGRLVVRVVWGARLGDAATAAESWGSVAAAYALRDGLALTGAAGVMPTAIERGLARAPFGRIGLRFGLPASADPVPIAVPAAAAPSLVVRDAGGGYATLRAHVPGARRVEVKGAFTDWQPVDLAAVGSGFWEARLRMTPGVHRVNMRVDGGAWIVPPGLPSLVDEFAGAVGVVVVE
ncbi:MAG TPA: glycogen-binding domain-containing protein, partial [Longimicrobiales bacterium]